MKVFLSGVPVDPVEPVVGASGGWIQWLDPVVEVIDGGQ